MSESSSVYLIREKKTNALRAIENPCSAASSSGSKAAVRFSRHKKELPTFAPPLELVHRHSRWANAGFPMLTDHHEVLELVLAPVVSGRNISLLARALINQFGTFGHVMHASASDLMRVEGMTERGAVALKTVGAAALHMLRKAVIDGPRIQLWEDLIKYVTVRLQPERVEVLLAIFLDSASRVITDEEVGRGTVTHVFAYPREIIRRCLELNAVSIVVVHNHPSGILAPSLQDKKFTGDLFQAAKMMDIVLLDHIIVGSGECFSFFAEGLL